MSRLPSLLVTVVALLPSCFTYGAEVRVEGVLKVLVEKTRTLTVEKKTPNGTKSLTLEVAEEAGDLASLKVGDRVAFNYDTTLEMVTKIHAPSVGARVRVVTTRTQTWKQGTPPNYAMVNGLQFSAGIGNEEKGIGFGAVGFELDGVSEPLRIAATVVGTQRYFDENSFLGVIVDYHTANGYSKRVAISQGLHSPKRWSPAPDWGTRKTPDQYTTLANKGDVALLDLRRWAPKEWDGQVWLTVLTQNSGRGTGVSGRLLLTGTSNAKSHEAIEDHTERWSKEKAWEWYRKTPWICGVNYIPTTGIPLAPWRVDREFDEETISRELGWASGIGINSIRILMYFQAWEKNKEGFYGHLDRLLDVADKNGMTVMPILFDDCSVGTVIHGAEQGPHEHEKQLNAVCRDPSQWHRLQAYTEQVVGRYKADKRIIVWDLYNEPQQGLRNAWDARRDGISLMENVFQWARRAKPTQPLTVGLWQGYPGDQEWARVALNQSDVASFHLYADHNRMEEVISELEGFGYPVVCTEWFARALGGSFEDDLPVFKKHRVGGYFFGLVADQRGTFTLPWPHLDWPGKDQGMPHPTGWFHNIFHTDGRPYRQSEVETIKKFFKSP